MKKPELTKRMARQEGVSRAAAADQLDRVVHQILSKLRKGKSVPLPGLGLFTPGPKGAFQFQKNKKTKRGSDGRK